MIGMGSFVWLCVREISLTTAAPGVSIEAFAGDEPDIGGCQVEILPLCDGTYVEESPGYFVEIRAEREEP